MVTKGHEVTGAVRFAHMPRCLDGPSRAIPVWVATGPTDDRSWTLDGSPDFSQLSEPAGDGFRS